MTQERWTRIKDVLATALELPPSSRPQFLAEVCHGDASLRTEVEGLLESSEEADDFIEKPALASIEEWQPESFDDLTGSRLGNYQIVQLLGEGGMGAVYRAIRDEGDFPLQVALKVVKRGMDTNSILRRFREERRILARLDHPNIAKLLDGGITPDGRPYFVMEFLEGTPITTYSAKNNLKIREKLDLFLCLCDAVDYSHRNLVVHRDLKPSNVIVSAAGIPKLLDFGIAKLVDPDASTGNATTRAERLMTPDFASPEQIRGETPTTSSDIYSLGVLLFELLTGQRPLQLAGLPPHEMARVITTVEPPKASAVAEGPGAKELIGDLDTIVAKAMHRSVERRYASVGQLADDVRRFCDGRPVLARPDTLSYKFAKFVGRNRAAAVTAAIALVLIFVSIIGTAWQAGVAQTREREARKRFLDLRELASSFLGELNTELEKLPGSTPAREILVAKLLRYLDMLASDDIRDKGLQRELALAYEKLGDLQGNPKGSNLGNSTGALASYKKELAILDKLAALDGNDLQISRHLAQVYSKVSDVLSVTGDYREALEYEMKALSAREGWLAANPDDPQAKRGVAASLQEVATDLDRLGLHQSVLEHRQRALNILQELRSSGHDDRSFRLALALAHKRLGRTYYRQKRYAEAIPSYDRALEIESAEVQADPVNVNSRINLSFSYNDKGLALAGMDNLDAAMQAFSKAYELRRILTTADPKDVRSASLAAATLFRIGTIRVRQGNIRKGIADLEEARTAREELSARDPKNAGALGEVAEVHAALGDAYQAARMPAEAIQRFERARTIFLDLRSRGTLAAEFNKEPDRIAAIMAKIRPS